ncbi:uncharacterized protein LOC143021463 [Oratosquilla oratoria]|uniref:uncharacterized protein LOC143021463 n=1 Tax=Oratosquilla oratoria TaxID=337810 RepID=UPI003F7702CC
MALYGKVVFVFSVIVACVAIDLNEGHLKETKTCEESCKQSSTDTPNEGSELTSCERGCRFYRIAQHIASSRKDESVEDVDSKTSPVMTICHDSCVSSYNETSSATQACKMGCTFQEADASITSKDTEQPSFHILVPLMQVRQISSRVTGIFHIIKSSIVTFFMSDNQEVVAIESDPEVLIEIRPDQLEEETPRDALARMGEKMAEEGPQVRSTIVQSFSEQLGIPPYLLLISVLALLLFMLYVLFGMCTISPKKKSLKNGLSIQSDHMPVPVKLVRTEDLTKLTLTEEEDPQAPPLPSKVKLPDSVI